VLGEFFAYSPHGSNRVCRMTANPEIRAPRSDLPRYCPDRALPRYRYVPGRRPHPTRDPDGHSFGQGEQFPARADWEPRDWKNLTAWLWGVDLFNRFYFWEAHEAWESLWRDAERDSDPALLLQGLIQVAAALLKVELESVEAAARLARKGIEKLNSVSAHRPVLMGLEVAATANEMRTYFSPLFSGALPALNDGVPKLRLSAIRPPGGSRP
jgi:predicted metal-dependent hydrolase